MKKITFLTLAILAGVSLSTLQAQAQDGPPGKPDFSEVDADGDGSLTPDELRAHFEARGHDRFAGADADADGMLSREELLAKGSEQVEARVDRMIAALDSDGDDMLTVEEMAAGPEGRRGPGGHHGRGRGGEYRGGNGGHHGGGDRGEGRGARMFERADTDSDGSLSADEWDAAGPRGRD